MLDKAAVANGEYWRLWTVTLVHGDWLHLFFNMYALFLVGPVVERWYGSILFVVFYLVCAAAGSVASYVFGSGQYAVGASGAIFGLFGILLAAGRAHQPIDRASRGIVQQMGVLIAINLVFGFASGGVIDNAAHIGGLVAGLWLGYFIVPTKVATMSAAWTLPAGSRASRRPGAPVVDPTPAGAGRFVVPFVLAVAVVVIVAGVVVGQGIWADTPAGQSAHVRRHEDRDRLTGQ